MIRELVGTVAGAASAPWLALGSFVRHARFLHPDGETFVARAEVASDVLDEDRAVAERLEGPLLARFSGAMWKGEVRRFEVLGLALRFTSTAAPTSTPRNGDQDVLFATILSPFTMPSSPFTSDARDFFANRFWAVSPFAIGEHRYKLRVRPLAPAPSVSDSRYAILRAAAAAGEARWMLEIRRTLRLGWRPLVTIGLERPAGLDEQALRFSAFRNGRGIVPVGVVHAMRRPAYAASQWARPDHGSSHRSPHDVAE